MLRCRRLPRRRGSDWGTLQGRGTVPAASANLDVAGVTLRTKRPKPCDLVSAFGSWHHSEASEDAHQVKCLALAGLTRVLAKPDADPVSVLGGSIEQ
jgi:hypothetical protein